MNQSQNQNPNESEPEPEPEPEPGYYMNIKAVASGGNSGDGGKTNINTTIRRNAWYKLLQLWYW